MDTKPGYKTTEFWLSLLAVVLPVVMPLLADYPVAVQVAGMVVSVLAALGYSKDRTSLKK